MDAKQLIELERKYSPEVVKGRGVFSPLDKNPHSPWNIGGDKMAANRNGYAQVYSALLTGLDPWVVVELGVFRGESLAIWCDLFPDAQIYGLDLEWDRFNHHKHILIERGAFRLNFPTLVTFDAYSTDTDEIDYFEGIDFFVDDGPHTEDAISNALRLFAPMMNEGGVYVIEDFADGASLLAKAFPEATIVHAGRLNAARL